MDTLPTPDVAAALSADGRFAALSAVPLVFLLVVGLMAAFVVFAVTMALYRLARYARAPLQTAPARCVAKRTQVTEPPGHSIPDTWYYATFQMPDGARRELAVPARDFDQFVEGDEGVLTWKDTILQSFRRHGAPPQGPISS